MPENWLERWNFDPVLLAAAALAVGALCVVRGEQRVRSGFAALGVLAFLYVSPFCALGSALFTIRIVHDVILAVVLAPLIMVIVRLNKRELPGTLALWTAIHAATFWFWHAPPAYEAAMDSDWAFWAMQITITGTAAVWWAKITRSPAPLAALSLLATMVLMGALGALLTFAPHAFYAPHWLTTQEWGLSPLEDQQIAGIIMWAPASLVYLLAALVMLYRSFETRQAA